MTNPALEAPPETWEEIDPEHLFQEDGWPVAYVRGFYAGRRFQTATMDLRQVLRNLLGLPE